MRDYRGVLNPAWRHGEAEREKTTLEYRTWKHMMERCYNPNVKNFKDYGDRGILVCERWHDFKNFLADMSRRPKGKTSLGRINNDGNYEPGNVRWETRTQQARNRRTTKLTMVDAREIRMLYSKGYTYYDLAEEFDVDHTTIAQVVKRKTWKEDEC